MAKQTPEQLARVTGIIRMSGMWDAAIGFACLYFKFFGPGTTTYVVGGLMVVSGLVLIMFAGAFTGLYSSGGE